MTQLEPIVASPPPTPARRSRRLALAALVVGLATTGGISLVLAQDNAGLYDFLRSASRPLQPAPAPAALPTIRLPTLEVAPFGSSPQAREEREERAKPRTGYSSLPTGARIAGERPVCVRMCDGYVFPIDGTQTSSDRESQEAACTALCPGAPTKVFSGTYTEEGFADAEGRGGMSYRRLPVAFRFQTRYEPTCSCQGPDRVAKRFPLAKDKTLRRGDIVVGERGAKVFTGRGKRGEPEFENLVGSSALSASERRRAIALFHPTQIDVTETGSVADKPKRLRKEAKR